jgi:hypothetical protein
VLPPRPISRPRSTPRSGTGMLDPLSSVVQKRHRRYLSSLVGARSATWAVLHEMGQKPLQLYWWRGHWSAESHPPTACTTPSTGHYTLRHFAEETHTLLPGHPSHQRQPRTRRMHGWQASVSCAGGRRAWQRYRASVDSNSIVAGCVRPPMSGGRATKR